MARKSRSSSNRGVAKENRVRGRPDADFAEPLNHEQERIQKWLKQVRFKKAVFGGVKEADVWKKILELNALYEAALSAERARYDALLAERTGLEEQTDYDEQDDEAYEDQEDEAYEDQDGADYEDQEYLNYDEWDFLDYNEHGRVDDE